MRDCSVNALRAYKQHCNLFVDWCESVRVCSCGRVNRKLIERYMDSLRSRNQFRRKGKLSPVTIHKRMKHLRTFFLWLGRKCYASKGADLSFSIPRARERLPKALSPEQVKKLLSVSMSERDRVAIRLMLDAGLRIAEVTALVLDDLDLVRRTVHVRHGKGDKERYALVPVGIMECLKVWLSIRKSPGEFLLVDKWGRHLSASGVYKIVKRVGRSAGVKVAPHWLRHTFATDLVNRGFSISDLQLLMGHEQIQTTMIYSKVALARVQERFDQVTASP